MAPLPKRRMSRARSGRRRQGINLVIPTFAPCPNCGKMKLSHTVCPECGVYGSRVVAPPKVKTTVKKVVTPSASQEPS